MPTSRFILSLSIAAIFVRRSSSFRPRGGAVAPPRSHRGTPASQCRTTLDPRTRRPVSNRNRLIIASGGGGVNDGDVKEEEKDDGIDATPTIDLIGDDRSERSKEPSMTSLISLGVFKLFSYCIQFAGGFFFIGLLLNLSGFGYTFDLDRGLVIDRIASIRNEVQFEREIEREGREDAAAAKTMDERISVVGSRGYIIAPDVPRNDVDSAP